MKTRYTEIGICGLSCRLCPRYHTDGSSRCGGCRSENRAAAGCPFITCAVKKRSLEFCWQCPDSSDCDRWQRHRNFSRAHDTFTCYQTLEDNVSCMQHCGIRRFEEIQIAREQLLRTMLESFNEGRSKRYYCIAAAVLSLEELESILEQAEKESAGMEVRGKSRVLHRMLDETAEKRQYCLNLRK